MEPIVSSKLLEGPNPAGTLISDSGLQNFKEINVKKLEGWGGEKRKRKKGEGRGGERRREVEVFGDLKLILQSCHQSSEAGGLAPLTPAW